MQEATRRCSSIRSARTTGTGRTALVGRMKPIRVRRTTAANGWTSPGPAAGCDRNQSPSRTLMPMIPHRPVDQPQYQQHQQQGNVVPPGYPRRPASEQEPNDTSGPTNQTSSARQNAQPPARREKSRPEFCIIFRLAAANQYFKF